MKSIERSREIRQWVKLILEAGMTCIAIDLGVNNGKTITAARDWAKSKIDSLKRKLNRA